MKHKKKIQTGLLVVCVILAFKGFNTLSAILALAIMLHELHADLKHWLRIRRFERGRLRGWMTNRLSTLDPRYYIYSSLLTLTDSEIKLFEAMLKHYRRVYKEIDGVYQTGTIIHILASNWVEQGLCRLLNNVHLFYSDFINHISITELKNKIEFSITPIAQRHHSKVCINCDRDRHVIFRMPYASMGKKKILRCVAVRIQYLEFQIYCYNKAKSNQVK